MLKKLTLAAVMALGALALLASAAQANKALEPLKNGAPFEGKASATLEGTFKFTGALGGVESTLDITLDLEGEKSTGEVSAVEVTEPKPFGLIGHCELTKAEAAGLPWTVHAEETTGEGATKRFSITEPELKNKLEGFLCPEELNITGGTVIATPDNAEEIGEVTLGGTVTTTSGNAEASGTLSVEPAGVYGIGEGHPLVPLKEGKAFKGEESFDLEGVASFGQEVGGVEVTLDLELELEGGSSKAEIGAAKVTEPSPYGSIEHCTIESAEAVGLPWTVHLRETTEGKAEKTFLIADPELVSKLSGFLCPKEFNLTGGTVVATPDDAESIGEVTLSGAVDTNSGVAEASGTLSAKPKGVYGIGSAPPPSRHLLEPLTEGKSFKGEASATLEGTFKFTGALGGIESTLDVTLDLEGENSTGEVSKVEVTEPEPFGLIGGCEITKAEAAGLPWTVHAEETTGEGATKQFSITEPEFVTEFEGFLCPEKLNITGGNVVATPDKAEEISSVSLSGTVTTTSGEATPSGTLNVTPKEHFGI